MQVAMKKNVIRRRLVEPKSSADNDPDSRDGGVQSVDRALSIIETLAEDDEGYRLSDLAVRTGLSTSTVHRLLATLEKRRFVQFDRYESKWHVGAQSFAVESREIMRSLTKVGGRVAMVASGVGKAVLATYSDQDVNAIIRRQGMPRLTEKSIVRAGELFRELEAIRRQGYAVDDEEARMGLRCVAAVVYNDCGEPLAAISVSGMTSRVTEDRLPAIGTIVREVAAELTAALGGVMPATAHES
jgi:IclR family acetate operon transcriptional repressor